MREAWYIDALDGLSGVAFASLRTPDLKCPPGDVSSWFVSAPEFIPAPVSSRAMALAATRRGMQLGVSMNGTDEVAFESIEALAEYVRRLFLSGGGGDGAGGVDPEPGGPEGDGEPPLEPTVPSEGAQRIIEPLFFFADQMRLATEDIGTSGSSVKLDGVELNTTAPEDSEALELLNIAVKVLDRHLAIQKYVPSTADYPSLKMVAAHQAFWSTLGILGLDRLLWNSPLPDALDLLASLPVPRYLRLSGSGTQEPWLSVKDALFGVLGDPTLLHETPHKTERLALFMFAAAVIVQRTSHHGRYLSNHGVILQETLEWLQPQLPKYAFTKDLEASIRVIAVPQ